MVNRKKRDVFHEELVQSPGRTALRNFISKKLSLFGLAIFSFIFLSCFLLPFVFPIDIHFSDISMQNISPGFYFLNIPAALTNNARTVSCGSSFGVGVDNDNNMYAWGTFPDSVPNERLREFPKNMGQVVQVSCGQDHILALNDRGEVFTWGYSRFGLAQVPPGFQGSVEKVLATVQGSFALDKNGVLHYWGNENFEFNPSMVEGRIVDFTANSRISMALTEDGFVYCLSLREVPFSYIPESIQGSVVGIAVTDRSGAAVTSDGRVHTWGDREWGLRDVPPHVQGRVKAIAGGRCHYTVLLDDGSVYTWGMDALGQTKSPEGKFASIEASFHSSLAFSAEGGTAAWGLRGYLMGSDQFGRDIFRRLLLGGRFTLTIGAVSVIIQSLLGILIGGLAGYFGGKTDMVLMRIAEIIDSIPFLPLVIILSFIIGNQIPPQAIMFMVMVLLGVLSWPGFARMTRAQILSERESEYVAAAKAVGVREHVIIFKHILPNIMGVMLVGITISLATSMLLESSLSFLQFGIREPIPTWGNMLMSCLDAIVIKSYWWRWVFPSLALGAACLSINIIGDGFRDAIDPKNNDR